MFETNQMFVAQLECATLYAFSSPELSVSFGHVVGETEGSGGSHNRMS